MALFEVIFISVLILVAISLAVGLVLYVFRSKFEADNRTIVLNFMSFKNHPKHFIGSLIERVRGKENREEIKYLPKDLKDNEEPIAESVIVEPNKTLLLSAGTVSDVISVLAILPHKAEDLDERFKNTDLGKAFQILIELKNVEWHAIKAVREGALRDENLKQVLGDGKLSKEYVKLTQDLLYDTVNSIIQAREPKKEGEVGSVK